MDLHDYSAKRIERLIVNVALTRDNELDCDQALAVMDEAAGAPSPALALHLRQCEPCQDTYDSLRAIAAVEASGALPTTDVLLAELERLAETDGATAETGDGVSSAQHATGRSGSRSRSGSTQRQPSFLRRWWTWLTEAKTPAWAPVALAAALVLVGYDQWRAPAPSTDPRASQLEQALVEQSELIDAVRRFNRSRFAQAEDGSWARVIFHDQLPLGMVYAGELPALGDTDRISCWLIDYAGERTLVWTAGPEEFEGGDQEWWTIEADRPLGEFREMVITHGPTEEQVVTVSLTESTS